MYLIVMSGPEAGDGVADARDALGRERALEQLVGQDVTRKQAAVQVGVVVRPALDRPGRALLEHLDQLVEDAQVGLGARMLDDVEGVVMVRAAEHRGQARAERAAGPELGERLRDLAQAALAQHHQVLEPDAVAIPRRVGLAAAFGQEIRHSRDEGQRALHHGPHVQVHHCQHGTASFGSRRTD
jgi:hypothetical protein